MLKRATFITKIVDRNGKTIYQAPTNGVQVLDPNVARTETDMLKGVLRNGTASATLGNFPRPAAGKTGTTDHNQDAWFVGYTPQYTAAVWMGNPSGEIPMTNVGGIGRCSARRIPRRSGGSSCSTPIAPLPPTRLPAARPIVVQPPALHHRARRRISCRSVPPSDRPRRPRCPITTPTPDVDRHDGRPPVTTPTTTVPSRPTTTPKPTPPTTTPKGP